MPTPDTTFKQLLLDALNSPKVKIYDTNKQAHRARFAMYDAMRQLRRRDPPDPFGDMKDLLEFLVRPAKNHAGKWELRIQRKSTRLVDSLDGWSTDETYANPTTQDYPIPFTAPTTSNSIPPPPVDTEALRQQIMNEAIKELDPANPRDAMALRRMEINDWLESRSDEPGFPYMEALAALKQAGDVTLDQFRDLLSSNGIH